MTTRRKFLFGLTGGLLLLAALAFFASEREPAYDGHSLSEWLVLTGNGGTDSERAPLAIQRIGTNALPFLLTWMEQKPVPWRRTLLRLRGSNPRWHWIPMWTTAHQQFVRSQLAAKGFDALGPAAATAVPRLAVLARDPDPLLNGRANLALRCIGSPAISALIQIAADTNAPIPTRASATTSLSIALRNPRSDDALSNITAQAIAALIHNLADADENLAGQSAEMLGYVALRPDISVPALTNALGDTRHSVRRRAVIALAGFKERGVAAVPALLQKITADREHRQSAIHSLLIIDPQALKNNPAALSTALSDPDTAEVVRALTHPAPTDAPTNAPGE